MSTWGQISLQDANSPLMEELIYFHDFTMMTLAAILSFVSISIGGALINKSFCSSMTEGQWLECIWTLIPAIILMQIAIPSLVLLYMLDESSDSDLTMKVMGFQWFWTYEFSDLWFSEKKEKISDLVFEANMVNYKNFHNNYLLETDSSLVVPALASIRLLISSGDVLHSWTIPSMGVKADACPGRLNQIKFTPIRAGVFYGQCSEICGANHSFMPIAMEVVPAGLFLQLY